MTSGRDHVTWLEHHAPAWADEHLISASQAEAILRYERSSKRSAEPALSVVAEVACYLGSVIAVVGGTAIIGPNWNDLGLLGQTFVALTIAAVGFATGSWLIGREDRGTDRLGSFLWMIGTGGVALAVIGVVNQIDPTDGSWFPITTGSAILAIGAAQWRNLERPLQLTTASAGLLVAAGGVVDLFDVTMWIVAPGAWLVSFGFGVLAVAGRLQPRLASLAVAAIGTMLGAFLLMEESERIGAMAAVATATLVVVIVLREGSWPLLALGVLAFFAAVSTLMAVVVEGVAARLAAVGLGLAAVATVAVRAQRRTDRRGGS